jgi:hypothetical protein
MLQPSPSIGRYLQNHYPETAVVWWLISRSLPSNGSACHNIKLFLWILRKQFARRTGILNNNNNYYRWECETLMVNYKPYILSTSYTWILLSRKRRSCVSEYIYVEIDSDLRVSDIHGYQELILKFRLYEFMNFMYVWMDGCTDGCKMS